MTWWLINLISVVYYKTIWLGSSLFKGFIHKFSKQDFKTRLFLDMLEVYHFCNQRIQPLDTYTHSFSFFCQESFKKMRGMCPLSPQNKHLYMPESVDSISSFHSSVQQAYMGWLLWRHCNRLKWQREKCWVLRNNEHLKIR